MAAGFDDSGTGFDAAVGFDAGGAVTTPADEVPLSFVSNGRTLTGAFTDGRTLTGAFATSRTVSLTFDPDPD